MQARPFPFPFPFQPTPHLTCQHSQNRYHGVPPAQLVHFEIFQKIAISAYLIKEWPPTTVTKSLIRYHIRVGCNSSPWAPWQTASRLSDNAPPPEGEGEKKQKPRRHNFLTNRCCCGVVLELTCRPPPHTPRRRTRGNQRSWYLMIWNAKQMVLSILHRGNKSHDNHEREAQFLRFSLARNIPHHRAKPPWLLD